MGAVDSALRSVTVTALALGLTACTLVDEFSDRALTYNLEAEQAQTKNLLLNVVRASLRRPMEFSTVQTVQGTAAAKGDVSLLIPFGHIPGANTLGLSGEVSAGTAQFADSILDTQEFYNGIIQPVAPSFINLLLKQGYPRSLIFYLFASSIEIDLEDGSRLTFRNYVGDDFEFWTI
jgi:hypothetical protein